MARGEQVGNDLDALDNLIRVLTHQHVISGNVGFTLCGVDNERIHDMVVAEIELHIGWESGTTHASNPFVMDVADKF